MATSNLESKFIIGKVLGSGAQATVRIGKCKPMVKPGGYVALKIANLSGDNQRLIEKEVSILKFLESRENRSEAALVNFYYDVPDTSHLTLVMEICSGKDLFENIIEQQRYSEDEAAVAITAMAYTLSFLQQHGVVHRDLKPENFMYSDSTPNRVLKLTDFGLACTMSDTEAERRVPVGTPAYHAPEIFLGQLCSSASDVWSLGVILYILLSGTFPFNPHLGHTALKKAVTSGHYNMSGAQWDKISPEIKDLVHRMLTVDPQERITIAELLTHGYRKSPKSKAHFGADYIHDIQGVKALQAFRATAFSMVLGKKWLQKRSGRRGGVTLEQANLPVPRRNFELKFPVSVLKSLLSELKHIKSPEVEAKRSDEDCQLLKYEVDVSTCVSAFQAIDDLSIINVPEFFNSLDMERLNRVDYRKVVLGLAALMEIDHHMKRDEDWVRFCFNVFDVDGNGTISRDEFLFMASSFCLFLSPTLPHSLVSSIGLINERNSSINSSISSEGRDRLDSTGKDCKGDSLGAISESLAADQANEEVEKFMSTFEYIDTDHSGEIEYDEFKTWLHKFCATVQEIA